MAGQTKGARKGNANAAAVSFRNRRLALEPRVLLDAAALETAVEVAVAPTADAEDDGSDALVASLESLGGVVSEAIFVDGALDDADALAASLAQSGRLVVVLDVDQDGLNQIRESLAGYSNLSAIHIVSHGSDGRVQLGGFQLSAANADSRSDDLSAIGAALSATGDIRLYGCDVALTDSGRHFVDQLADLTGADVAASDDTTGISGDWDLEYAAGTIESSTPDLLHTYLGDLELEGLAAGVENGGGAGDQLGWATAGSGEWVVSGGWNQGEVQVWRIQGTTRTEQILAPPGGAGTSFGRGVAIHGNQLVVAAPDAGTDGMLYIYSLNTTTNVWSLTQSININIGGANIGPWTGFSNGNQYIDINNGRIVVGAPNEGSGSGRVVFLADTSGVGDWSTYNTSYMDEPTGFSADESQARFGASVSLAKDYVAIGAAELDQNGQNGFWGGNNGARQGGVFIYQWTEGSTTLLNNDNRNGYLFNLVGEQDTDGVNGGTGVIDARFGAAVDMEFYGGKYTIVVGAPGESGGEIYIYQTTNSNMNTIQAASNIWGQTTDGHADRYGGAVAVSQARVMVGAGATVGANTDRVVWYYESPTNVWTGLNTNNPAGNGINVFSFTPTGLSAVPTDRPGWSMAFVQGSVAAIGSYLDDGAGTDAGQVIFRVMRTPLAVNDFYTITEDTGFATYNITGPTSNDVFGSETLSSVTVEILSQQGLGAANWNGTTLEYNPGQSYQYLAAGESVTVTIVYRLTDNSNSFYTSTATVVFTINGLNDAVGDGVGLDDIVVPQANEPVNSPSPSSPSTGSILIRDNVFTDVDISNDLTYTIAGVTTVSGTTAQIGTHITINGNTGFRTGTINYNLSGVAENTVWDITIRASDGLTTRDTTFRFTVARANETPEVVSPVPDQNAVEDAIFTSDISGYFTDPDFSPVDPFFPEDLTFTITSQSGPGPDWLVVGADGVLSGVPTNDNALSGGVHTVTVRATDIFGNYVEDTFNVTVANTNDAPVLIGEIGQVVAESGSGAAAFSFSVIGANTGNPDGPFFQDIDPTGDTITYTAFMLDGTPITASSAGTGPGSWIRFDDTGSGGTTFSGTPTDSLGTVFTVRLVATDNHGAATETLFEVGVFPPVGDMPVSLDNGATAGDRLGWASSISGDGRWAVYGAPGDNGGNGSVQIFENVSGTWTYRQTISTGMVAGSRFGTSVSLDFDGNRLIVGAPMENGQRGAIYYYERATTSFAAATNIKAVGTQVGERLGTAVAVNEAGNNVLAGAPLNDNARGVNAGAAYRFGWNATTAAQTRLPTLDAGETSAAGDMFGISVAFNENMQVVGASRDDHSGAVDAGSVYVSTTDNSSFTKLIKQGTARDADYFGASVSVDSFAGGNGVVVAVGASGDDTVGSNAGAVYIYRSDTMVTDNGNGDGVLNSLVWQSTVFAYDSQPFQNFGASVAVDVEGDTLSNGMRLAIGSDINASNTGSVYGYRYWAGYGWVGQRYEASSVLNGSSYEGNQLGFSVGIAGKNVIAGAPSADRSGGLAAGLVYGVTLSTSEVEVSPLSSANLVKTLYVPGYESTESVSPDLLFGQSELLSMTFDDDELRLSADSGFVLPGLQAVLSREVVPATEGDLFGARLFDLLTANPLQADMVEPVCGEETENCEQQNQEEGAQPDKVTFRGFGSQLDQVAQDRSRDVNALLGRMVDLVA